MWDAGELAYCTPLWTRHLVHYLWLKDALTRSPVDQTDNLQIAGRMLSLLQPVFIVYLVQGSTRADRSNYDRWIGRRHAMKYKGQLSLLMEKAGVDD